MKRPIILSIIILQVAILGGVAATAHFTFMNKERIRATQRVMVETKHRLGPTFSFMDDLAEKKRQAELARLPLEQGSVAPSFALLDENEQEVNLTDYKGKKTLLVFSQQSCPYCQDFYPILNEFQEMQSDVNVVVMQLGSTPEENKIYKDQQGIKAQVLAATFGNMQAYKIKATPTSVLIDEEGKILGTKSVTQLNELQAFVSKPSSDPV